MSRQTIYIDTDRGVNVVGPKDSSLADLPPFVQGDSLPFRLYLLSGFSRVADYLFVPVSGITIQMAIGAKVGDRSAIATQQYTWTASTDLADPYFDATLPMNTAEITALLRALPQATAFLEIKMVQAAVPSTVLSRRIVVHAAVIKPGALIVAPGLTPLSAEAAAATFLGRTILGRIRLMDETGSGYGTELWTDETGLFHADPITP